MCKDREDELVIIFESMREVIKSHNSVFDLFSKKCLLKEVIELDLVEFTNDEYIYDIIGIFITEIEDRIRYSNEIKGFASFEEFLHWLHNIICLHEHLDEFRIDRTIMIHLIVLFFILFI